MAKVGKSIRVEQHVLDYITSYKGNGFNEQFENIILDAMESEKSRLQKIKSLDKTIIEKENRLQDIYTDVRKMESVINSVNNIIRSVGELEDKLN